MLHKGGHKGYCILPCIKRRPQKGELYHGTDVVGPHAGAIDNMLGFNAPMGSLDANNTFPLEGCFFSDYVGHRTAFYNLKG